MGISADRGGGPQARYHGCRRRTGTESDPVRGGVRALDALRRAALWFRQEEDITLSVVALHLGSVALAVSGQTSEATRLRDAVHGHAQILGLPPDFLHRLGSVADERNHAEMLDMTGATGAASDGARLSWAEMAELLAPR